MDPRPALGDRTGAGGIAEQAPELVEAVNAVRLNASYRELLGLTPSDAGSLEERVLARVVIEAAVVAHNADVEASK